jgi:hypothetical protein
LTSTTRAIVAWEIREDNYMAETGKSFWHTAAGMITAVAALVTALGGVLAILVQNDVIAWGSGDESSVVASSPGGESNDQTVAGVTTKASQLPWDRATATLVRKDGGSTTVKAATVGLACAFETLIFENGQRLSLELVRSIQFDAIYLENSSADGVVTLLDGQKLTDPIHTWNCPVMAANQMGSLEIPLKDIKRIDFNR